MNLATLSLTELKSLAEKIQSELKRREADDIDKARAEILAIAKRVGIPLQQLVEKNVKERFGASPRPPVPVRYRNPNDATKQWSGRGRQPKWIKEWTDSGKELDALRVGA